MKIASIATAAAVLLSASAAYAAPASIARAATPSLVSKDLLVKVGSDRRQRGYTKDCRPYNGPYGYYGNPYCEGGFSKYERAAYRDGERRRRWR